MPRVVSFIVLVAILLFIAAMFFKVMAMFVLPLFMAAVLVVVFKPLHMRVREMLPGRLRISALVTTLLIMLIVFLPTGWLGWNAFIEGRQVFSYLQDEENRQALVKKLDESLRPLMSTYATLTGATSQPTGAVPQNPPAPAANGDAVTAVPPAPASTSTLFNNLAASMGRFLIDIVQGLVRLLIGLIIMLLALYYFLVDGPGMIHTMMRLSPLDNSYERELLDKFANVSRAVVVAVLASAVVQGLLAGIGFYFALTPGAPIFLLTMITMVGAVVPFVGAAGVWIPTCLWIYFYQENVVDGVVHEGNTVAAVGLAVYCAGIVSTIDNVIKPLVLHGQSNLHPLLALMSVLGGVKALGPVGILVGPMLVAFIHALLVMVNKELRMLSSAEPGDPRYDKAIDPAFVLEASAAGSSSGVFERLVGGERTEVTDGTKPRVDADQPVAAQVAPDAKPASRGKRPGPIARATTAAKRRRKRK